MGCRQSRLAIQLEAGSFSTDRLNDSVHQAIASATATYRPREPHPLLTCQLLSCDHTTKTVLEKGACTDDVDSLSGTMDVAELQEDSL